MQFSWLMSRPKLEISQYLQGFAASHGEMFQATARRRMMHFLQRV